MCNITLENFATGQIIAGVATAGIPWGAMVADKLKLPFIYVRPKPKTHGLENQIEGFYEKGMSVIVIEDLISTGKSSIDVINVLKRSGLQLQGLISLFNYGFKATVEAFESAEIKNFSLLDYYTLIPIAIEQGIVSSAEEQILLKWRDNPAEWLNTAY